MKSLRIVVVEDNAANRELISYLLSAFGHQPLLAVNGESGLACTREQLPDLVLCDIQMPGLDGFGVARALKASPATASIPLVALTASAMLGDRERILAAGFDAYIAKPIDPETIVSVLEDLQRKLQAPAGPLPTSSHVGNGLHILVADDRELNLALKRSLLEPLGYRVTTATGMTGALQVLQQSTPDLIISDINMGEGLGSGFDFITTLKADPRCCDIPFIFVTSTCCDRLSQQRALALGAQRFIMRPVEPEQLLHEIEACLNQPHAKDIHGTGTGR